MPGLFFCIKTFAYVLKCLLRLLQVSKYNLLFDALAQMLPCFLQAYTVLISSILHVLAKRLVLYIPFLLLPCCLYSLLPIFLQQIFHLLHCKASCILIFSPLLKLILATSAKYISIYSFKANGSFS